MQGWLVRIGGRLCYLLAGLVIMLAIVVILSRLFVPLMDQHRPEIERWATTLLQTPVKIGKARFSWYRYQPELTFDRVTVIDKKTQQPKLQIERLSIFFSIFECLWQKKLIPSAIRATGSNINIIRSSKGAYALQGFQDMGRFDDKPYQTETSVMDSLAWLSSQPKILLEDINVKYKRAGSKHEHLMTLKTFSFENQSAKHVVLGKAILKQDLPTEVEVAIRWDGDGTDPEKVTAKGYVYATGVSLPQWLGDHSYHNWKVKEGVASTKVWLTWDHQALQKVQSLFKVYQLELVSVEGKRQQVISSMSGDFGWRRDGSNQIIAIDDLVMDLPTRFWPITNIYAKLVPDQDALSLRELKIAYLPVDDTIRFVKNTPNLLPRDILAFIDKLDVRGDIYQAAFQLPEGFRNLTKAKVTFGFAGVGFKPWRQLPGLTNVSGGLSLSEEKAELMLDAKKVEFISQAIFHDPVLLDHLTGKVTVLPQKMNNQDNAVASVKRDEPTAQKKPDIYRGLSRLIKIQDLKVVNEDLAVNINGDVVTYQEKLPKVNLAADFSLQRLPGVNYYLPMHAFDDALVRWLNAAFIEGKVTDGRAVLRGNLERFPFDTEEGEFSLKAKLDGVGLQYAPNWPSVNNIMGNISFKGRDLKVHVDTATTEGIAVGNVDATIPSLGAGIHEQVNVEVRALKSTLPEGLKYVANSPLNKTLGKVFNGMEMTGPLTLNLALVVPLNGPEKTSVLGTINVTDAEMNIVPWHLFIKNIHGQVHFTDDTTSADGLNATLFGKPFSVNMITKGSGKGSHAEITSSIPVAVSDIEGWLDIPLTNYLNGVSKYDVILKYSWISPLELDFKSKLNGTSVAFESFAKKGAEGVMPFSAQLIAAESDPLKFRFNFNDKVAGALTIEKKNNKPVVDAFQLSINEGKADWPKDPGLSISGDLPLLNWEMIQKYGSGKKDGLLGQLPLAKVELDVDQLQLFGHTLKDVALDLEPASKGWLVDIDCPTITGSMTIPKVMDNKHHLVLDLSRLKLETSDIVGGGKALGKMTEWPAISFKSNRVTINSIPFGTVRVDTQPMRSGVKINSLRVDSANMSLSASGSWKQSGNRSQTQLRGRLNSQHLSKLLSSMKVNADNVVANKATVNFDLSWPDVPYNPNMRFNGTASIDVGTGRIINLGEQADGKMGIARLLNLFSLQTIPRRLSLNFSDLVEEGYSFDYFRANMKLKNGNAYTSNMRISGPSADVRMNGRIGLTKKDYDLTLSVTPHVTQSLPVAATILTGQPLIGLAAMAVNTVLGQEVSKATTYHYEVTGPWSDPDWVEVRGSAG